MASKTNLLHSAVISLGKLSAPFPAPAFLLSPIILDFFHNRVGYFSKYFLPSPTHFLLLILLFLDSNSLSSSVFIISIFYFQVH